jgi:autotransporter-associated beta strand protein
LIELKPYKIAALILGVAGMASIGLAQSTWNGSTSTDWNNAANWTGGVPNGGNAIITTTNPRIATITSTISATPVDILVGTGAGVIGRVDHISGDAFTGNGNWMFLGFQGGNATYNLANTATTGGTFTGYGQGSGNLYVGGIANPTGNLLLGLDNSTAFTMNINSSGTVAAGFLCVGGTGANSGTFNLDNGTVNISGQAQIGGDQYGQNSGVNHFNMSGGSFTANLIVFARGDNNAATLKGIANLTGGTLSSGTWFTLGFAGSSSAFAGVTNSGATINVNTSGGGNMEMTVFDPMSAYYKQTSGALNLCNSAYISFGNGGNNSGTATFDQNGGTVTFYSDTATTVGGTGYLSLGTGGDSGTYAYNLNGGTLTVPSITRTTSGGSGTFNFNGGTLKPTASTATFMQGLTAANIQSGGAKIDMGGNSITIGQGLSGTGSLTQIGTGTLTLSGNNTYTGSTIISDTLALSGTATLASQVVIPSGKILDVTGLTVGIQNLVSGVGSVNGNAISAVGMDIYPATNGTAGTLTFNNDLNMSAGGSMRFDLSTTYNSGNDQVVVGGNLTVSSSTVIRIKALSGAANLSTVADYVLCSVAGTTAGSMPSLAWDGSTPANYLSYSVQQSGNNLVLHYTAATAPTVTATGTPATLVRNQAVTVTAAVTPGTGTVTNVVADASQIGGSATAKLVLSGTPNVYTNTFVVASGTTPGVKLMAVVAMANTGLNSPAYTVTNTVVATNETWTGLGANDNWTTSPNWNIAFPASSGDAVTFAGTTRLTPNLDANASVTGVTFGATAGSFNIGTANSSTLTLTANGVLDLSANPQTLNVPLIMGAAQTFNAVAGTLIISNSLDKGGNLITVTGAANAVISANITGSGSLFKTGSGLLTVPTSATWDLAQASSGGFSGPLISQAGTLAFNNGSVQTVSGELVIGGVIADGGAGNNAKLVVDNATMNVSSWLSIGRGNGVGGVSSDLVLTNGAVVSAQNISAGYNGGNAANLPKGSVTLSDTSSLSVSGGNFFVGESDGSDMTLNVNGTSTISAGSATLNVGINSGKGALNLNGGSVSVGALRVGSGANAGSTAKGTVTVNSGTLASEGDIMLGFAGSATDFGTLVINSAGTVNIATSTKRWLIMNQYDTANSELDVNGGNLNINAGTDIRYAIGNNTGTNTINLNSGAITFYSDNATTVGGSGVLDLHQGNGATVQNIFNLNGGTFTVPGILSANTAGTSTFNFNGGTLKPTATSTTFLEGLSAANVKPGGAIIDTAGSDITIAQPLLDAGGGLTKLGAGTLTLSGSNTYTNTTAVNAGTLALTQPVLSMYGTVTVASGAMLQLDFLSTSTNQVAGLVLNGISQAPGVYNATTSPSFISGTGNLLVAAPINPNPPQIQVSVSGSQMTLAWPANAGWILQSNSVGLTASSSWFNYPANGAVDVTSVNVTMNPAKTNVFFRMVKP